VANTPPVIANPTSIDEVVDSIESIIDWSIGASSRLGYFAALYKRITVAVGAAVARGAFQDNPRMEAFDVAFANRYFAAVNGHFHPDRFAKPTHSWQVAFDAADRPAPIILQQLLVGINAHILLDLGIVAQTIEPGSQLPSLHQDFDTINAVLASQVNDVVAGIDELSPVLASLHAALQDNEINIIDESLITMRDSAWSFATILAGEPDLLQPATILAQDLQVAQQGALILNPPPPLSAIVGAIADSESRNIADIIAVLNTITEDPAAL
jgi:hypothetical protein